jgi:hypothetical protein
MAWHRMQIQRAMGLMAVKKNRHRSDGDMGNNEGVDNVPPPRNIQNPCKQ